MRIGVVGCGYLGLVHAVCMAELGNQVIGIETDAQRISALREGRSPIYEPGLDPLLQKVLDSGALSFSDDISAVSGSEVIFVCVGTPQLRNSEGADLSYVRQAFGDLVKLLQDSSTYAVLVGKSTVPVGTAESLAADIEAAGASLVWNPEFLREGFAVQDTLHPDRIVYGTNPADPHQTEAIAKLDEIYRPMLDEGTPRILTDFATAQLVKMAANGFLAMKISFINAMANLCAASGGDVKQLAHAIGLDDRIGGKFLRAGVGFGGGCIPKDSRALKACATKEGADGMADLMRVVDTINNDQLLVVAEMAREMLGGSVDKKRIAILGASFKPNSDDIRNSPALSVAEILSNQGARVAITDPAALDNVRLSPLADYLRVEENVAGVVQGADLVMLLTEWKEYCQLDPQYLRMLVAQPRFLDGRNALDAEAWIAAGWEYRGIGRYQR